MSLKRCVIRFIWSFILLSIAVQETCAQEKGSISLRVYDAFTGLPLPEATVTYNRLKTALPVMANGTLDISLIDGPCTLIVQSPAYKERRVSIEVMRGGVTPLDVFLLPVRGVAGVDSVSLPVVTKDSGKAAKVASSAENIHMLKLVETPPGNHSLRETDLSAMVDRDLSWVLRRSGGAFLQREGMPSMGEGLIIAGMGERYNQYQYNGMPAPLVGTAGRKFAINAFPAEAIAALSVSEWGRLSSPADYAGGQVDLKWKDIPVHDFTTVQAGVSFLQGGGDGEVLRSPWNTAQWVGFPSKFRELPAGFPSTRSKVPLSAINPQEKADLLDMIPNGLETSASNPPMSGTRFLFGIGRRYKTKSGSTWGFTGHLLHQTMQENMNASLTYRPDLTNNPYPYSTQVPLVASYSQDRISHTGSSLSLSFGTAVSFRKNLIRMHLQAIGMLDEVVTDRMQIYKPDEDTVASVAKMYQPSKLGLVSTQFSGEHALGKSSSLQLTWQVAYAYSQPEKPDERHFLLRNFPPGENISLVTPIVTPVPDRDNIGSAALAANLDAIFTNSYRHWETAKDHQFSAKAGMRFPFQLSGRSHVFEGGLFMQTQYREQYADRLMYWGGRPALPETALGAGQYYPGGVNAEAYYSKIISSAGFFQVTDLQEDNLGNYTGSLNSGSAYMQYSGYLLSNLVLEMGLRAESSSQLVSSTEYNYFEAFKKPRLTTLNENATVSRFDLLPLIRLRFEPLRNLVVQATYHETLNHPQMQELAPYRSYDPASFIVYKGNPNLTSARIRHFIAGIQWRSSKGLAVYADFFERHLDQPIEEVVSSFAGSRGISIVTPYNMPDATVTGLRAGVEIPFNSEGRRFWSYFSIRAGAVFTQSEVDPGPIRSGFVPEVASHNLAGTPDYTAHAGFVIKHPAGFGFSAIYQAIGPRLRAVGSGQAIIPDGSKAVLAIPHYQEKERSEINLQMSWSMFKKRLSVICGVDNLFRTPYILYQDLNGDGKFGEALRVEPASGGGIYKSGQDNVLRRLDQTPGYYFRLMYTW